MVCASFNIVSGIGTILTTYPNMWVFNSIREFTNNIRYNCLSIAYFSSNLCYDVSNIKLYVNLYEELNNDYYYDRTFIINCKNIREYKNYIGMCNEEIHNEYLKEKRNQKLNFILE
jgi:hypothetical protein